MWVVLVRPALHDGFRHLLFTVPLILMLLFFGFVYSLTALPNIVSRLVIVLVIIGFLEVVLAMRSLHPYEYVYYNPLTKPAGEFELEYWGTSFRELAEQLNGYAASLQGEKLRLYICGPSHTLMPFLDNDKFESVQHDAAPQLTVALNIWNYMGALKKPWLISIGRSGLIFAAVARS